MSASMGCAVLVGAGRGQRPSAKAPRGPMHSSVWLNGIVAARARWGWRTKLVSLG